MTDPNSRPLSPRSGPARLALSALLLPLFSIAIGEAAPPAATSHLYVRPQGNVIEAAVEIAIQPGWHIYHTELGPSDAVGQPTTVALQAEGVDWRAPRFPAPQKLEQRGVGEGGRDTWAWGHSGKIVVRIDGSTAGSAAPTVTATIKALTCKDEEGGVCVPYRATLSSEGPGSDTLFLRGAPPSDKSAKEASARDEAAALSGEQLGLGSFLALAVAGGLFTLLMPCTYPMIPITISFFTKQATQRGGKVTGLALAYGLGIVLVFVLIGIAFGSVIIPFATSPITNLVIGAVFVLFALSLFGAIDLEPPRFLLDLAGGASQRSGYIGVFLMGSTLVVTSFTCTAPFVGSLLSVGAQHGALGRIILGMATFGLTMAIPFVLLSLLPGRLGAIPKSGEWMHTLKVVLGFVELAAALKFLSNSDLVWQWGFLTRELFLILWFGIFLIAALYLLGLVRLVGEPESIRPGRFSIGTLVLLFALYCGYGALGHELDSIMTAIAPNYSTPTGTVSMRNGGGASIADAGHVIVLDDYDGARDRARAEHKQLLVNFTGHTCVNCRLMEEKIFKRPLIAQRLEQLVEARLHTDGERNIDRILALQEQLTGVKANPFYVLVDPESERVVARFAGATRDEGKFYQFISDSHPIEH